MKHKRLKLLTLATVLLTGFLVFVISDWRYGGKSYPLKDYFAVTVTGLDGSGVVNVFFDYDRLLSDIAGEEKNAVIIGKYRQCLDTISYEVKGDNGKLKNGDSVEISIGYDEALLDENGIKVENTDFKVEIDALSQGTEIDVFEKLDVIVAGVSPEAYVNLQNNWEDGFLSQISFSADKTNKVAKGDIITVTCTTKPEEFAMNGYIPKDYTKEYLVKVANSYIDSVADINQDVLMEIWLQIEQSIIRETTDLSFRILYKATEDEKYLYQYNREEVLNTELEGVYYLKKKDSTYEGSDNYVVFLARSEITNQTSTVQVYFAFEYANGSKDDAGKFGIPHNLEEEKYFCSGSMEKIYQQMIGSRSGTYNIEELKVDFGQQD